MIVSSSFMSITLFVIVCGIVIERIISHIKESDCNIGKSGMHVQMNPDVKPPDMPTTHLAS